MIFEGRISPLSISRILLINPSALQTEFVIVKDSRCLAVNFESSQIPILVSWILEIPPPVQKQLINVERACDKWSTSWRRGRWWRITGPVLSRGSSRFDRRGISFPHTRGNFFRKINRSLSASVSPSGSSQGSTKVFPEDSQKIFWPNVAT